ncbi:hypothetical protein [Cryptosporangium sp. NPDC051539]|uniref:hypothetical protein n=1 Tax=Cryptosporangium sp. NPDC051539 TaxID=3363962 RepID=UPI00379A8D9A
MPDLYQFVDSITEDPTILLDLSLAPWSVLLSGTTLGPPPLRRARVTNLMSHGDHIPAAAYGNQILKLALLLQTEDEDAVAVAVQRLAWELDRPTNLLRHWPAGQTHPVFYRTIKSELGPLEEILTTLKQATIPIEAEPFALGLKQTLAPVTISGDPATGCYFEVNGVLGDVETPLYLEFDADDVIAPGRREMVISVRRRGNPANAPWILQAEAMDRAANTTLPGNDPTASGTGNNYTRSTSLTSDFVTRLSGVFGSVPGVDVRGKSRLYGRFRKTNATGEVRVRLAFSPDGVTEYIPDTVGVVLPADTVWRWVDLGTIQIPFGYDPGTDGPSGVDLPARGYEIRVQQCITDGASNLETDAVVGMPADDRLCKILWPGTAGPTSLMLDSSARPKAYGLGAAGEVYPTALIPIVGGTPMVSPNDAYNLVRVLDDAGTKSAAGHLLNNSVRAVPIYWPRYLGGMRPPTT